MSKSIATFSDGTPVPFDGKFHVDPANPDVSVKCLEFWMPPGVVRVLSGGNTARLGLLEDGSGLKYAHDPEDNFAKVGLGVEHQILSALGNHARIVKYYGRTEHGLQFRREINGDIRNYIKAGMAKNLPISLRFKWSMQTAEAIAFVHSIGVIHCDVHPNNLILDEHLDVKLCDFSGSLFRGLDGGAMESTRFYLPRELQTTPCAKSDIFALGSTFYYIMEEHEPYHSLSDEEVSTLYSQHRFPDVSANALGQVITGCWSGAFDSMNEVVQAISDAIPAAGGGDFVRSARNLPRNVT